MVQPIVNRSCKQCCQRVFLNGTQVKTSVSDLNGVLAFTDLIPGTYTLTEITPPIGYLPNTTIYTVVVNQDGNVTIDGEPTEGFTISNVPIIPQSPPPVINVVFEYDLEVIGSGEPGCGILVTFPGGSIVAAVVNSLNIWHVLVPNNNRPLLAGQIISAVQQCSGALPSKFAATTVVE